MKADIGLIGLAVMGQNLVLNINDKGYSVAVYNRTKAKTDDFLAGPANGREGVFGAGSIKDFVESLAAPRKVMLMVKAGEVVDKYIDSIVPHMDRGDIIIDGGNSHFADTIRRTKDLTGRGILYVGTGISGGEEGARHGPSIMPGGNPEAWPKVQEIFQSIAAKTPDGDPCCSWIGEDGAGHYVKMVHNGIEYGDMQLIAEAYHLMRDGLGMSAAEMREVFARWNEGDLDSFLIEITRDILGTNDSDGKPLLENILDAAGQKGTGKWTGVSALDMGIPVTLVIEAVLARSLSAFKAERVEASKVLKGAGGSISVSRKQFVDHIQAALLSAKIVSYAQGFMLIREAAREHKWNIDFGAVADLWRGGCIIRSAFLTDITKAFSRKSDLHSLLLDDYFSRVLAEKQAGWRSVVAQAVNAGIPVPAFSSALAFYDGYRCESLPANMIQAQRDYFGAHTYERKDKPRGQFFHTNWTGTGGDVSAGSYNA